MSKDKHFSVSHYHFESRPCSNPSQASGWALPFVKNLGTVFCDNFCVRSECMTSDGGFGDMSWVSQAQSERERDEQWKTAQKELHEALAYLPELEAVAEGCAACAVTKAFCCFPLIVPHSPKGPVATVRMNAVDCWPEVVFCGGDQRPSAPCVVITTMMVDGGTVTENIIREKALLKLDLASLPRMPPDKYDEIKAALGPGQAVMRHLYDLSAAQTQSSLDVEDDSYSGLEPDNSPPYLDKESLAFTTLYHQVGGWESTVKPSTPTVDHETSVDAFVEQPSDEPSGEVAREMKAQPESGAIDGGHVSPEKFPGAIRLPADLRERAGAATLRVASGLPRQEGTQIANDDPDLIRLSAGADFYNIPKSTLSKAAKRSPGDVGYLWSRRAGRRVFLRKTDLVKLAQSRNKLGKQ